MNSISGPKLIDPIVRLQKWLEKRGTPIPEFKLQKISMNQLEKYVAKLKGSKCCGIDQIDSYCLKLSAPYIDQVILHIVNTVIEFLKS